MSVAERILDPSIPKTTAPQTARCESPLALECGSADAELAAASTPIAAAARTSRRVRNLTPKILANATPRPMGRLAHLAFIDLNVSARGRDHRPQPSVVGGNRRSSHGRGRSETRADPSSAALRPRRPLENHFRADDAAGRGDQGAL